MRKRRAICSTRAHRRMRFVGAGGIGLVLQGAIDTFNWQEAATVLLAILVLVIIGEFAAAWLRKRII